MPPELYRGYFLVAPLALLARALDAGAPRDVALHPAFDPALPQLLLEDLVDDTVLVLVLHLDAALLDAQVRRVAVGRVIGIPAAHGVAARWVDAQYQVLRRYVADVEVLVEPDARASARDVHAPLLPVAFHELLTLAPHEHVALAMGDVQVSRRPVPVAFLVRAGLKARDVRVDGAAGEHEERIRSAAATLFPLPQPHAFHVGDEVRLPDSPAPELALRVEVLVLAGEAVLEVVVAVPDEVLVADELPHHLRQVRHREEAARLEAAAVVVLHRRIERNGEECAFAKL